MSSNTFRDLPPEWQELAELLRQVSTEAARARGSGVPQAVLTPLQRRALRAAASSRHDPRAAAQAVREVLADLARAAGKAPEQGR